VATMVELGQDKRIQERVGQLEQMRLITAGQIADLEQQIREKEGLLAWIEGGQIELRALLNPPTPLRAVPDDETEE
jgi:hypothetical protein